VFDASTLIGAGCNLGHLTARWGRSMVESREQPDAIPAEPPWQGEAKLEPTDAEIEAWAEEERRRRQSWLQGPTPDERAAYARRERERRLAEIEGSDAWFAERARTMGLLTRKGQLAAEGAMSLFMKWSRHTIDVLVDAGREWEEEFGRPRRRRRVQMDDDAD
jgi:hypothetical protein